MSAVLPIIGLGLAAGSTVASLIPSKMERQYRKELKKEKASITRAAKRGEGGLTQNQRERMMAEAAAKRAAWVQTQQAMIARIQDPIQRQQAQQELQQKEMQMQAQDTSAVRAVDVKAIQQRKKAVLAGTYQAAKLEAQRKARTLETGKAMAPIAMKSGAALGESIDAFRTERMAAAAAAKAAEMPKLVGSRELT